MPDLASEHTVEQDVAHCFKLLSAEEASQVSVNAAFMQKICRPTMLLERKPKEKLALGRALSLPKQIDAREKVMPHEEGVVR